MANAWREAHVYPLRLLRHELTRHAHKLEPTSVTAGRLKRFQSIRRKLKRGNISLYQIQDISGCRAIMSSQSAVTGLVRQYVNGASKHELIDQDDYISQPKADGYRSRHLVYRCIAPEDRTAGNRLVVEIQIRSRLQHAWATAVEAVGFVRAENLKAGEGSADWLRLFQLMSGEIAALEGCPMPPSVSADVRVRRDELRDLNAKLGAVQSLDGYSRAIRQAESYRGLKGHSFLIRYDIQREQVTVQRFSNFASDLAKHFGRETLVAPADDNTVLVEVDRVENLLQAYPNYFLDVRLFNERLKVAVFGERQQAASSAQERPRGPPKWGDLSWLRDYDKG